MLGCGLDLVSPPSYSGPLFPINYPLVPRTLDPALHDPMRLSQTTLCPAWNITQVRLLKLSPWQPSPALLKKSEPLLLSAAHLMIYLPTFKVPLIGGLAAKATKITAVIMSPTETPKLAMTNLSP